MRRWAMAAGRRSAAIGNFATTGACRNVAADARCAAFDVARDANADRSVVIFIAFSPTYCLTSGRHPQSVCRCVPLGENRKSGNRHAVNDANPRCAGEGVKLLHDMRACVSRVNDGDRKIPRAMAGSMWFDTNKIAINQAFVGFFDMK
ncbi:hypothetical protein ACPUER_34115 [Burkholderia sp. DN3021]|uniref:hypothetical protein n=1 Tax=Burkholderia sp. DN3021 TaxID=3410137 RepID=UPI003C79EB84